jgi:hypothetical protein
LDPIKVVQKRKNENNIRRRTVAEEARPVERTNPGSNALRSLQTGAVHFRQLEVRTQRRLIREHLPATHVYTILSPSRGSCSAPWGAKVNDSVRSV